MKEQLRIIFSQRVLTYLILAYCASSAISLFLSSYFNYNLTESLIFNVNDGWCNPKVDGIGNHCFGDFYQFMNGDFNNAWTEKKTAYSALGVLYFLPFKLFITHFGATKIALIIHLSILLFCIIFPVLHLKLSQQIKKGTEIKSLGSAILLSAPALMAFDRGNNVVLCVPFLYLYFLKTIERKKSAPIYGIVLVALRPQFALFVLFPLFRKNWKETFTWIFGSISAYLVFFSFFGFNKIMINIESWIQNLTNYQSTVPLPMFFPSNWSFSNVFSMFVSSMNSTSKGEFLTPNDSYQINVQILRILPIIFLITVFILIFIKKSKINDFEFLSLLTILILLTPGVTFSYYLVLLLIPILFVYLADSHILDIDKDKELIRFQFHENILSLVKSKTRRIAFISILFSILIPWSVPWFLIGINRDLPYAVISMSWTLSLFILFFWFTSILFSKGGNSENRIGNNSGI
jgi:hypothetical protein